MVEHKTIPLSEVPAKPGAKWTSIFDPLDFNSAEQFDLLDITTAKKLGQTIQQTLRAKRRDYRVRTRKVANKTGISLYVWKIKPKDKSNA